MAGRLTVWGASQLLITYFGRVNDPPPIFYLALIREIAPDMYVDGTELDEPDASDYARVPIPNDLDNWANDSVPQEIYNVFVGAFATAASDWGMIRYWALCNAEVDGNNLIVGQLENPVQVVTGDQVVFAEGDLNVALGPFFMAEDE